MLATELLHVSFRVAICQLQRSYMLATELLAIIHTTDNASILVPVTEEQVAQVNPLQMPV